MAQPRHWFNEDTVRRVGLPGRCIVVRAWNDANEDESYVSDHPDAPPPLRSGQVEVFTPLTEDQRPFILADDQIELLDRQFLPGDFARDPNTGSLGVVIKVDVQVRLITTLKNVEVQGWVSYRDLNSQHCISRGDIVTADDWIGQVEEVFEVAKVEGLNGREPFKICDIDRGLLTVGATSETIRIHHTNFYSLDMPTGFPDFPFGRVIDLRQTAVAVNWLAINQMLPPAQQNLSRPKRIWTDLDDLTIISSHSRLMCAVGDVVTPSSLTSPVTKKLFDLLQPDMTPEDRFMTVFDRRSRITIKWMDGTVSEQVPSTSYEIGDFADEEHDAFPGEAVMWQADGEQRVAIVQKVDTKRRVTEVRWWGTEEKALVSSLELDPNGKPPASYGTRRGDIVLLSPAPVFASFPDVPRIGQSDDVASSEEVRQELTNTGFAHSRFRGTPYTKIPRMGRAAAGVQWVGTVHDLFTDGTVSVQLPDDTIVVVPHDHVYLFLDHESKEWGPDEEEGEVEEGDEVMDEAASQGSWQTEEGDDVEIVNGDDGSIDERHPGRDWAADSVDGDEEERSEAVAEDAMDIDGTTSGDATPRPPVSVPPVETIMRVPGASSSAIPAGVETAPMPPVHDETIAKETPWKPFLTMEEAPSGHHFYGQDQTKPPRNFLARLRKEYAALESSLPENIIVRAYEDRTDLLRACIIGSADTPYEDACFLFDLYLPPAKFPQEPPQVFFHSWTNGGGRIQPNLYEQDGKVCLSVLGTWAGDSTESWSASRSSLLQVLVSISGLCLVKDPYFCEPGYEKQRGTLSGRIAANLYSERAYVLTRGFIKHALEYGVAGGFDEELRWLYLTGPPDGKGRLPAVVEKAKRLIAESEAANGAADVTAEDVAASGALTLGGAIPLKRTVAALERRLASVVAHV